MRANVQLHETTSANHGTVPGGIGWEIEARTLRPRVTDLAAFRDAIANDPAAEAIEALWTGKPKRCERLLLPLLDRDPSSVRLRALRADAWRDQGRTDAAINEYQTLLERTRGTNFEPTIRQHLGKALFAAGRFTHALRQFSMALEQRIMNGADPHLIDSTMQAMSRTQELLELTRLHKRETAAAS